MSGSMDFQALGQQFCTFYYDTFDKDRAQLAPLYVCLTLFFVDAIEEPHFGRCDRKIQGTAAIVAKLTELPFKKVAHRISTLDAQPSSQDSGGVLVMVTGELLIDEEQNPQRYSQVFHLLPEGGSYYVLNDIFRLNWG